VSICHHILPQPVHHPRLHHRVGRPQRRLQLVQLALLALLLLLLPLLLLLLQPLLALLLSLPLHDLIIICGTHVIIAGIPASIIYGIYGRHVPLPRLSLLLMPLLLLTYVSVLR
jgi:hypothetical protein